MNVALLILAVAPVGFWETPRAGANFFNRIETPERFAAAADTGIELVRLAPDKWEGTGRDPRRFPPHDRPALAKRMEVVASWQARHHVPSSRVVLEEFGVPRVKPGAAQYLADVISLAEEHGWHWLFYGYREDTWDQMDYELGDAPLGAAYWGAVERGETPVLVRRPTALWHPIAEGLARRRAR